MHQGKYSRQAIEYATMALQSDVAPGGEAWVPAFESRFASFSGAKYAISVNSATSGIHASLLALRIGPGDEVISPGLTVIMDAYSTIYCGATPVFADVDPHTWNLLPASVESLVTPKTKAILAVSWFGHPADLKALRKIADKHHLALIDDSAETMIMPQHQDSDWLLPNIRVFSFESKKHFSTGGEGGMVTTDDPEIATRIRKAAGIGYKHLGADKGRTHLAARDFQRPGYLRFDDVGYNYRMTPVSAAIGLGQLENIDYFLGERKRVAELLRSATEGFRSFTPQNAHPLHSYYTFAIRYETDPAWGTSWQEFYDKFTTSGGDGFYSNCMNPYLEPSLRGRTLGWQKFEPGLCPTAEALQGQIMAFKTNYLDFRKAEENAEILTRTLNWLEGSD